MLIDSVRVTPGMLPPTISTTPNSPIVCANVSATPVTSPENDKGTITRQKVRNFDTPSTADAFRSRESTAENEAANGCTAKGRLYSTDPMTRPSKVKASVCPVIDSHQC